MQTQEGPLDNLKEAPRIWSQKIDTVLLTDLGFRCSAGDPCLYCRHASSPVLFVAIYGEDLLIAGCRGAAISSRKSALRSRFKMRDIGNASTSLVLEIVPNHPLKLLHIS